MPRTGLFDRTIGLLQKTLDLRMQNQQVISANIANADTPGYRAVHLRFEDGLKRALANSAAGDVRDPGPLPAAAGNFEHVRPRVVRTGDPGGIGDRNGVDLEEEMIALAENQMLYEAATQMISKKFGLLRYVIQGGR
ncbi:MAG: flagellar basal body rod protein FlgB [Desulfobacterales bacterium]|nr:flagellar basal body rod protein FlgB [Desulfobacterales bacterium]